MDNIHPDYLAHVVCGIDECNGILPGRPSGGVAVLWKKKLSSYISKIKPLSFHRRICAIRLTIGNCDYIICSTYMPNDTYSMTNVSSEFSEVCNQIDTLISSETANHFILAGDLNVDYRRNNAHSKWIADMTGRHRLVDTWTLPLAHPDDTYVAYDGNAKSRIDYFMCPMNLSSSITELAVLKRSNNPSNHRPIKLGLHFGDPVSCSSTSGMSTGAQTEMRCISWNRVHDKHIKSYQKQLDEMLKKLTVPPVAFCQDLYCENPDHKAEIDQWCNDLTDCCLAVGYACLPKCRIKSRNRPGWSEHVKHLKENSKMCHNLWIRNGAPESGDLYEAMRDAKREYFYAARTVVRGEKQLRFQRMAQKAASNHNRQFWDEVKTMKKNKLVAPNIDGVTDEQEIAEVFRAKYEDLFTSVPPDDLSMQKVLDYINGDMHNTELMDYIVSEAEVTKAIEHLKSGKSDGNKGLLSNHIKHAPRRMHALIALLLTVCTKHGYIANEMLLSSLTSIPKDPRGNICDSENYRGIALSSCLSKIHDIIIMNKYSGKLCTSDMQYAFKGKHGTTMCTLMLKEVASYFKRNNSDIYMGLIDASKAFDRVRHDRLFLLLIERKLPAVIIRIMLDSYKRQKLFTKWNTCSSQQFGILNGIKQGSVISPILFTVYMDVLLLRLEACGYGCKIGSYYYGALSYADDLTLLCPTVSGFQKMLKICETFGSEYAVKYNPSKSVAMCISRKRSILPNVFLSGQPIKWVSEAKHLGNFIRSDLRDTTEINKKRGDFIGRVNNLLATFYSANDDVKREIFNTQCSHLYGSEAWNMMATETDLFRKTWNHGVRRTFKLPYRTHTRYLHCFTRCFYITDQIHRRFYRLLTNMSQSENLRVSYLTSLMMRDSSSIICNNLQCIANRYDFNYYERYFGFNIDAFIVKSSQEDERTMAQIMELRGAMIHGFTEDDIHVILNFLCCD